MFDDGREKTKQANLYWMLVVAAILISTGVYIYFSLQSKIYKSSGKIAVFYSQKSTTSNDLLSSVDVTKSVAESIKTRRFLEDISQVSGVTFSQKDLDNGIGNIVKADLITNSNIVTVEFNNQSKDDLNKINDIFPSGLNASKIVSDKDSSIMIKTIDPLYTFDGPIYPEPFKYAVIVFVGILFLGLLMIYTLLS